MAFIFASNPDSLAGQRNYYDQMNVGLAQADQAARQRAVDEGQRRQLQAQQDAQSRQDAAFQFAAQQQAQQQANQENEFRFNLSRQDQATAAAEDTRRFNVQTDLQKQQLASTKGQADYAEAINAIESGDVATPDDLKKSFGSLTPVQQQRASMYLTMKAKKETQDYQSVMAAANAATGLVASKPVTTTVKPHWWSSAQTTTTPAAKLTEDEAFAKLAPIKALSKFLPALTWDENTQRFLPAIPKPEWQPAILPGAGPPSGTAAAPAPSGNPPPAPASFAPTPTAPPTTHTLIDAGTVYKGYMFQGGDPADPKNWTPVGQTQ